MLDLAREVLALTGSDCPLAFEPLPADDPQRRRPDIETARWALGWQPVVSLREGLIQTIEAFRGLAPESEPASARAGAGA